MARLRLDGGRGRWARSPRARGDVRGRTASARAPDARDCAYPEGQRGLVHGRPVHLALSFAERGRPRACSCRARRGAMRTAFARSLVALAERDSRVWLLTGDLG